MSDLSKEIAIIARSRFMDKDWYLETYPDVKILGIDPAEHYFRLGARLGRNPSKDFNTKEYLKLNPKVVEMGVNPLVHFEKECDSRSKRQTIAKGQAASTVPAQSKSAPAAKEKESDTKTARPAREEGADIIIKGFLEQDTARNVVKGWLALIGDEAARRAIVKIDDVEFPIVADTYRPDLERGAINKGKHSFVLAVPDKYIDGIEHKVILYDKETAKVVSERKYVWYFKDS